METVRTVELFKVRIRFEKLFADPSIFEHLKNLARSYFAEAGIGSEIAVFLQQVSAAVVPVDDTGRASEVAGIAGYKHHGRRVSSEYMKGANLRFEYVDFGSGLSNSEHSYLWSRQEWGPMRFQLKEFAHEPIELDLPDLRELYAMLKARASPTTMASVELPGFDKGIFQAVVGFVKKSLDSLATADGLVIEVYVARDLSANEKLVLEKRLGRESTDSTVHLILSRAGVPSPNL